MSWRGRCPGGVGSGCSRFGALFEVFKNLLDVCGIFDTGNNLGGTATLTTGLYIDIEHTFEALRPAHGGTSLCGRP